MERVKTIKEAQDWFLSHSTGSVIAVRERDNTEKICDLYLEAEEFLTREITTGLLGSYGEIAEEIVEAVGDMIHVSKNEKTIIKHHLIEELPEILRKVQYATSKLQ
jgi:hypothetical protein